ncbi:hypothetical protein ACQ4PT_030606 [Festuca glaucescens]
MLGIGLGATIGKAMAAFLRWLRLALGCSSWEAAATALLLLWRRLLRRALGDTAPWSELPPELLGLVLSRLPSQADRVRLRAVCRPWRSAARLQPLPPPLPWLVLRDDTFITLPDGAVHRMPLDSNSNIVFRVSTGSMFFLAHHCSSCYLMNPSSWETIPLQINILDLQISLYRTDMIQKVVVSDHIVAVLVRGEVMITARTRCSFMAWAPPVSTHMAVDIALFQGKLYVLTTEYNLFGPQPSSELLHLLDIVHEQTCITSVQCIRSTPGFGNSPCLHISQTPLCFFYLVASGDRLLMVKRTPNTIFPPSHLSQFEVSEAVDLVGGHGRWCKVDTLVGRALFISRGCSESLPAQCGAQEDCIYFMTEQHGLHRKECIECTVYNVRDKTLEQVTWVKNHGPWHPTWLFPDDI